MQLSHEDLDLFGDDGLEALLQLNHLVLLGRGYDPRESAATSP
jgi:hypothetical protein